MNWQSILSWIGFRPKSEIVITDDKRLEDAEVLADTVFPVGDDTQLLTQPTQIVKKEKAKTDGL